MPKRCRLVSGSTTYEWVVREENLLHEPAMWKVLYGDRPMFVFTTRSLPRPEGADVRFASGKVTDHFPAISAAAGERAIWVVGGGGLAGQFHDAGLLDAASRADQSAAGRGIRRADLRRQALTTSTSTAAKPGFAN